MIFCEKARLICDKVQYNEATFIEKLRLKFHLFMCKTCSAHSAKNGELTSLCSKAQLQCLSDAEKEAKSRHQVRGCVTFTHGMIAETSDRGSEVSRRRGIAIKGLQACHQDPPPNKDSHAKLPSNETYISTRKWQVPTGCLCAFASKLGT